MKIKHTGAPWALNTERPTTHPTGNKMDYSELDASPELARYYASGERIEITWEKGWGMNPGRDGRTRCYVGKSTGWRPCWLMILKSNSMGGMSLSMKGIKSIRGLGRYKGEKVRRAKKLSYYKRLKMSGLRECRCGNSEQNHGANGCQVCSCGKFRWTGRIWRG